MPSMETAVRGGHGTGGLGSGLEKVENGLGKIAVRTEAVLDAFQFIPVGKTLVEEQINDFLKTAHFHKIINIVSQIQKAPFLTAHITQSGFVGDDAF